jgi:hypothetical protein
MLLKAAFTTRKDHPQRTLIQETEVNLIVDTDAADAVDVAAAESTPTMAITPTITAIITAITIIIITATTTITAITIITPATVITATETIGIPITNTPNLIPRNMVASMATSDTLRNPVTLNSRTTTTQNFNKTNPPQAKVNKANNKIPHTIVPTMYATSKLSTHPSEPMYGYMTHAAPTT